MTSPTYLNGTSLRLWREWRGITIEAFAERAGVNDRTVRRWENNPERYPLPDGIWIVLRDVDNVTEEVTDQVVESLRSANRTEPVEVPVYTSNDRLWEDHPEYRPLPASWHRRIVWNAIEDAYEVPVVLLPISETDENAI